MGIIEYINVMTKRCQDEKLTMEILREKINMIYMMREDKSFNNSFIPSFSSVNEFFIFINELSDYEYEIFVSHIANFRKSYKKINRWETRLPISNYIYKITCIYSTLNSCYNELKHMIYIIDNFDYSLKWNLHQINFPIQNILQFTDKKYIIVSLQNQLNFIEKILKTYENKRFSQLNLHLHDGNIPYDKTIATHIQAYSNYSIYFVLLFNCSNICKIHKFNTILKYYFSSSKNMKYKMENMLRSVHHLPNWEMILEDDDMELFQNYYLPHPDHFVYIDKSLSKDKLVFKLSFPYGFFIVNR